VKRRPQRRGNDTSETETGSENWASVQMELQSLVGKRKERKAGEHCSDCISGLFAGLEEGESLHRYISTSAFTGRSQHVSAACWTTSIASRIAFPGTHHSPPARHRASEGKQIGPRTSVQLPWNVQTAFRDLLLSRIIGSPAC
jgi:hypothetical protein